MGYQLPGWMQWLQAVALITIPLIGAFIAYKQSKIASAKLNLDLFEKRYAVFEAMRSPLLSIIQSAKLTDKELITYNWGVVDAPFLFNEEMEEYANALRKKFGRFMYVTGRVEHLPFDDPRRDKYIEEEHKMFGQFETELNGLRGRFREYLNLRHI